MSDIQYYNRNIDLIKGLLIIFVITLHFPFRDLSDKALFFPFLLNFSVPGFMFISGYVRTLSFKRKGYLSLEDAYAIKDILKSILRLAVPFTLFFVFAQIFLRIIGFYTVGVVEYGLLALGFDYLRGFIGQGAYYFPIMIQFVFVFPVIWRIVKKMGFAGVWFAFGINIFYEILKQAYGMSDYEYRFLVFRYLFIISCGCYAAIYEPKIIPANGLLMILTLLLGAAFIYLFVYSGYGPSAKIITYWQGTSAVTCLYAAPLMFWAATKGKLTFRPLEVVGQASFNIFLVQILYYLYYHFAMVQSTGSVMEYLASVIVCVCLGIAFYYPEKYLTGMIIKKMNKKDART